MEKVEIFMLGRFSILYSGRDILDGLGNSKKKIQFLQYLLVNRNDSYTNSNLFEHLWPSDDTSNPESALKTLVSRLRHDLRQFGLEKLIATRKGVYKIDRRFCSSIDLYEFEDLAGRTHAEPVLTDDNKEIFERILALYQGDLLSGNDTESWIVHKSMYYHTLFLQTIYKYIDLLSDAGRYDDITRVSGRALETDEFDSRLNLEYMKALISTGRKAEALNHYNYTVDLHYSQLGIKPSEAILDFYSNLIRSENDSTASLETISADLENDDADSGAFVCDYAVFKDIYRINMRNMQRLDIAILLAVITVSCSIEEKAGDHILHGSVMSLLQQLMQQNLRKGDTISRYNVSQFAVLLPSANMKTGTLVMERIKNIFYRETAASGFVFSYKLKPLTGSSMKDIPQHRS